MSQEISQNEAVQMQDELNQVSNIFTPKSWFIDKSVIIEAFDLNPNSLTDFSGLRVYPGAKDEESISTSKKTLSLIIVAVDNNNNDIIGNVDPDVAKYSKIFDRCEPCPNSCPSSSNVLTSQSSICEFVRI